jgi:hypothetical protein
MLSSVQTPSRHQLSVIVLTVVVLASTVAAPVISVARAQAATGTNATNTTTGATQTTPASGGGGMSTGLVGGNVSKNVNDAANTTNTTNSTPGGNTSRLSSGTSTGELNQTLTNWVQKVAGMNASQAKQAVKNNPQKAKNLRQALKQLGVKKPKQMVQNNPRKAARKVAGLVSLGSSGNGTSGNATNATNASAGGGSTQVQLRKCSGGFIESAICKVTNFLFGWIIGGIVSFVQGVITGIVNMIFGFSVPKVNGHIALFQKPTNQPWTGLYESWKTEAMPLGIIIWLLMILGVMFTQVFTSDPSTALKVRELRSRSWKVLLGILGSWAIGAAFLFVTNGIILTIAPDGSDIASNLAVFTGSVGAAGAAALLVWFFEGILFLFIVLLLLAQKAMVFIMMWSLAILIPLAAIDVGPVKYISKPARGIIDMFVPFIMMTLPMALVLRVGYEVVNALNQSPIAQLGMWASGANVALILGFWIAAAVSPLFVFSQTGKVKGMAAGLLGASVAANSGGLKEKVEDAKSHYGPGSLRPDAPYEGTDQQSSDTGEFGGALPGSDNNRPSMLEAGTQDLPERGESTSLAGPGGGSQSPHAATPGSTTPETDEAGNPELPPGQPLAGGNGSSASASSSATSTSSRQTGEARSNPVVSHGDVTRVQHPRDLPDETKYNVGRVKDNGEFRPITGNPDYSRSGLLTDYNNLNRTRHYEDKKLVAQSQEDEAFYDLDSMTHREESYEQMSRDTSEDVLNS